MSDSIEQTAADVTDDVSWQEAVEVIERLRRAGPSGMSDDFDAIHWYLTHKGSPTAVESQAVRIASERERAESAEGLLRQYAAENVALRSSQSAEVRRAAESGYLEGDSMRAANPKMVVDTRIERKNAWLDSHFPLTPSEAAK